MCLKGARTFFRGLQQRVDRALFMPHPDIVIPDPMPDLGEAIKGFRSRLARLRTLVTRRFRRA
jgi:hypothetical protein